MLELILQWKSYQRLNEINRRLAGITPEQYAEMRRQDRSRRNELLLVAGLALIALGVVCALGVL